MQTESMDNRRLLRLAVPNILTNLTVPLAGLIDVALLGHLEDITPLAGVALGSLIFDYLFWSFGFLRMTTTGLVAQASGAEDLESSAAVFFRALFFGLGLGIAILVLKNLIGAAGFAILEGGAAVEEAGLAYYHARIWSAPATLAHMAVTGWLLGRAHVRSALVLSVVLNGLNIVLNYIFIYELRWGAAGAGTATFLAETATFLLGLIMIRARWGRHPIPSLTKVFQREDVKDTLAFQANILVRTFCLVTVFSAFTNLSAHYGKIVLAANTILLRFLNTCAYFIDGFSYSLEALAGAYAGGGNDRAMKRALQLTLRWNIALIVFCNLLFLTRGEFFIGLLTHHAEVIAHASADLPWMCTALLFSGFAYIYDGYFLGLARGMLLRNAMLVSTLLGFLPFALAAIYLDNPDLLWWGMVSFMAMRALTLAPFTRR
ncbi:MAG: MATE family efflux transporter [Acidobacteriota bacterium]|nr:MATE family efflux transporter [Acidobacteriota bacterium]